MARGSYLWDHEKQSWEPRNEVLARRQAAAPRNSSAFPCPMVIGTMTPVQSPIDGKFYDSKAEYYRHVEQNGGAIVGFDKNWEEQIKTPVYDERKHEADIVADVKKAIEVVNSHGGVPNEVG